MSSDNQVSLQIECENLGLAHALCAMTASWETQGRPCGEGGAMGVVHMCSCNGQKSKKGSRGRRPGLQSSGGSG